MCKVTAGRDAMPIAPVSAPLNDVLCGEVWPREDKASFRVRSLTAVTAFMVWGILDGSFPQHIEHARANGVAGAARSER